MSDDTQLRTRFGQRIRTEIPLAQYTTLRIGGPAQFLLEAQTSEDLVDARRMALGAGIPFTFLAGCSNVLIDDAGLRGLVVINKTHSIEWLDGCCVRAAGGCNLDRFVSELCDRGWGDLSFAAGIPGSLGGALAGGAGAFGRLVFEFLKEASVLHKDGSLETLPVESLGIRYRGSIAKDRQDIILDALMGPFESCDRNELLKACESIRKEREIKHPGISLPSAGSFFKNLPPAEPGGRRTPAGKLLEEIGAKDLRYGDAGVFEKHANIIVNYGSATCSEVNQLADEMARRVKEKFNVDLEREVQYLR